MDSVIKAQIEEHSGLVRMIYQDVTLYDKISKAAKLITRTFRKSNKVLLCGNGGSAADAEHIAAELSGKFKMDRRALFAEALHVNSAALTAISNDFGYKNIFIRMLEAKAQNSDVLICYSTSGQSENVILAAQKAKELDCKVISFCGLHTDALAPYSDILINIPHQDTARIQEAYMLISHIICHLVESELFKANDTPE